jgi:ligand-binding sensor domain-containing protein
MCYPLVIVKIVGVRMKSFSGFFVLMSLVCICMMSSAQANTSCALKSNMMSFESPGAVGLPSKGLMVSATDNDGVIYIGTGDGVYMSANEAKSFTKVSAIKVKQVFSVVAHNGRLYVGGFGVFGSYDPKKDIFKVLKKFDSYVVVTNIKPSKFNNSRLYVVAYGKGLLVYNIESNHLTKQKDSQHCRFIGSSNVSDVYQDEGYLYIAANQGMCIKSITDAASTLTTVSVPDNSPRYFQPYSIVADSSGVVYATARNDGLWRKKQDESVIRKMTDVFNTNETKDVRNLYIDRDCGACYVATYGQGVAVGRHGCDSFDDHLGVSNGLASDEVRHVYYSQFYKKLFIVTSKGLSMQKK